MPQPHSETLHKLALDGPLSLAQLIALGLALMALIGFFAWRDYKLSRSRKLFFFSFLPRLIALLIALWMLAGVSSETLSRQFKPKSVVLLVDSSASMGMTDPVDGSGDCLRWIASQNGAHVVPEIETLDGVIGTLRSAQSDLRQMRSLTTTSGNVKQIKTLDAQIQKSIEKTAKELNNMTFDPSRMGSEFVVQFNHVRDLLKQASDPTASTIHQTQSDRLQALDDFIQAGLRQTERLSEKLATHCERTPLSQEQTALTAQSKLSRKQKTADWLDTAENSWLKELSGKVNVLRYSFASEARPASEGWQQAIVNNTNEDANSTDITAALGRAAQDSAEQSVQAVVLVTDGGHNVPGDPRDAAATLRGAALYVVPIGATLMPRDVILHHAHAPRAVFKNDTVMVDAMISAYGCEGEVLNVELLSDDVVVDKKSLTADSKMFDTQINFQWKAESLGRHILKVRVLPLPREHSLDNNQGQMEVEVMEDTIHVLIADDFPRWEFRYLVNLFKRDKHIDFEQVLFEPNTDADSGVPPPSFPQDMAGWRKYNVIILGDVTPDQLPPAQQEMLKKYVAEEGGNLIVVAGENAMPESFANQPLASMLPVTASPVPANQNDGYGLAVTAEGSGSVATQIDDDPLASDRVWREMSVKLPVYNLSSFSKPKPTGHVLIAATTSASGAPQQAFLSWEYVGLGRVIYIAAPITYQLRYRNGDFYHHRFWGQLLRWAMARDMSSGSKTVHLITDKNTYEQADHAQIVLRLAHPDGSAAAGGQCSVEAMQEGRVVKVIDLHEQPDAPGTYRGTYEELPLGPINLRAAGPTVHSLLAEEDNAGPVEKVLTVERNEISELSNPLCNLPLLNQIADAAGGAVVPPGSIQNALSNIDTTPETRETVLSWQPVWNSWLLLWIFIFCLTTEWIARKHWRMV